MCAPVSFQDRPTSVLPTRAVCNNLVPDVGPQNARIWSTSIQMVAIGGLVTDLFLMATIISRRVRLADTSTKGLGVVFAFVMLGLTAFAGAPETRLSTSPDSKPNFIVVGFVGGFVHSDDIRHPEVQVIQRLRDEYANAIHVGIFENRYEKKANTSILNFLDRDKDGSVSDQEKGNARIILFGHSWGASAVVLLARELQREGIPVLLTVQVDSIVKNGQNDSVIPANVAQAINFYQTRGILHGRTRITAADPTRTQILGDFRFDYTREPAACSDFPWYDRQFFKGHTSIECDPHVWSRIESLIQSHLPAIPPLVQTKAEAQIGSAIRP